MSDYQYPADVKLATIGGRPGTITVREPIPVDSSTDPRQAQFDAGGIAVVNFGPVQPGYQWRVERIAISSDSALASAFTLYLDSIDPTNIVESSPSGNSDIADETQPILVPEGSRLIGRWTGGTPGALASARIQYTVYVLDYKQLARGAG